MAYSIEEKVMALSLYLAGKSYWDITEYPDNRHEAKHDMEKTFLRLVPQQGIGTHLSKKQFFAA